MGRSHRPRERSFGSALALTVVGTVIPGLGLLAAGRRRLGGTILGVVIAVLIGLGLLLIVRGRDLMALAVQPAALAWFSPVLFVVGAAWVGLIVGTYRSLRPWRISPLTRIGGSLVVVLLALAVMLPMAYVSRLATIQSDLISTVFRPDEDIRSETKPENVTVADPWGGRDRVNILLIGSDGGKGRVSDRADSVMVASIDTERGDTALFSLPRNLLRVPFPAGSKLHDAYPDGFYTGSDDSFDNMLAAIYNNVPRDHPDLLDSDNPGADATKLGVGAALGLTIDYYVLVDLDGFDELVDALGGITVNINYPIPIGGSEEAGRPPSSWLEPGPDQHLRGDDAVWYARGRYQIGDYKRMQRQRCFIKAVIDQADPVNILRRYERLANASKEIVHTDIPDRILQPLVDLALRVKDARFESVVFDNSVIVPHQPDYDKIQRLVQQAIRPTAGRPGDDGTPDPAPASSADPGDGERVDESDIEGEGTDETTDESGDETDDGTGSTVESTCGYHPES